MYIGDIWFKLNFISTEKECLEQSKLWLIVQNILLYLVVDLI